MLKFGFRKNNFYPLMLLLFIFLRICIDKIFTIHPYKKNIDFIISFLIFFSQSLIGAIIYLYYNFRKKKVSEIPRKFAVTSAVVCDYSFFKNKSKISNDNTCKKICLIIFASFFNFITFF